MKDYSEETALSYLPLKLQEAVKRTSSLYNNHLSEIRLRAGCPIFITIDSKNISCGVISTFEDIDKTVRSLCGNSLYSHSETIKEGYISTTCGIRAGIGGRAITDNGKIVTVTDISSVSIRIPHRIRNAGNYIADLLVDDFGGVIIYSPPGVGKTTVIRELTAKLSSKPYYLRIAVIDTRFEICAPLGGEYTFDALSGYPRDKGIEAAMRALSPELIVCDEIGTKEEASAIMDCAGAGVPVCATAHADSYTELLKKQYIKTLIDSGIFKYAVGLSRKSDKIVFEHRKLSADTVLC